MDCAQRKNNKDELGSCLVRLTPIITNNLMLPRIQTCNVRLDIAHINLLGPISDGYWHKNLRRHH